MIISPSSLQSSISLQTHHTCSLDKLLIHSKYPRTNTAAFRAFLGCTPCRAHTRRNSGYSLAIMWVSAGNNFKTRLPTFFVHTWGSDNDAHWGARGGDFECWDRQLRRSKMRTMSWAGKWEWEHRGVFWVRFGGCLKRSLVWPEVHGVVNLAEWPGASFLGVAAVLKMSTLSMCQLCFYLKTTAVADVSTWVTNVK